MLQQTANRVARPPSKARRSVDPWPWAWGLGLALTALLCAIVVLPVHGRPAVLQAFHTYPAYDPQARLERALTEYVDAVRAEYDRLILSVESPTYYEVMAAEQRTQSVLTAIDAALAKVSREELKGLRPLFQQLHHQLEARMNQLAPKVPEPAEWIPTRAARTGS
jgi:hypothetical protein